MIKKIEKRYAFSKATKIYKITINFSARVNTRVDRCLSKLEINGSANSQTCQYSKLENNNCDGSSMGDNRFQLREIIRSFCKCCSFSNEAITVQESVTNFFVRLIRKYDTLMYSTAQVL